MPSAARASCARGDRQSRIRPGGAPDSSRRSPPEGELKIRIKRIYEQPAKADGRRILVDRLWPRGLKKETAGVDLWVKQLAPSSELRKWYGHRSPLWPEFKKRYFEELDRHADEVEQLLDYIGDRQATLVFSSRETEKNNAWALKEYLESLR